MDYTEDLIQDTDIVELKSIEGAVAREQRNATDQTQIEDKFIQLRRHALNFANQIANVLEIKVCENCGKNKKYN